MERSSSGTLPGPTMTSWFMSGLTSDKRFRRWMPWRFGAAIGQITITRVWQANETKEAGLGISSPAGHDAQHGPSPRMERIAGAVATDVARDQAWSA